MRIRTDGDFAHRQDTIESVAEFYGRNNTESLLRAADDVPQLVAGIVEVLEREDLTLEQRRALAETLSTRHFEFEFSYAEDGGIEATISPE